MNSSRNRPSFSTWVVSVLLFSLLLRVTAALYWQSSLNSSNEKFRFGDSETYWFLAETLYQQQPYQYTSVDSRAFRAPGYPLFLASTFFISSYFDSFYAILIARLAGCIAGVVTIGMLMTAAFHLAKANYSDRQLAEWASIACGLMASVYLGAIGMSIFILSEAAFCPMMAASLILWNRSMTASTNPWRLVWCGLAGVASGAACLCRPSWILWPGLLVVICFIGWLLGRRHGDPVSSDAPGNLQDGLEKTEPMALVAGDAPGQLRSDSAGNSVPAPPEAIGYGSGKTTFSSGRGENLFLTTSALGAFAVGMVLMMSPWWIRNYLVFEAFVPTTLQVGASLYDGLHDGASGSSDEGMRFTLETEIQLREFDRLWHARHDSKNSSGDDAIKEDFPTTSLRNVWLANHLDDLESDRLIPFEIRLNQALFSKAISWAIENPYATAKLALIKSVKMWTPGPTATEIGGLWVRLAEAIGYLVIGIFAVVGFLQLKPCQRFPAIIYASPVFYFAILHTIFVGSVRYRQPAILVLTIVSGIGAAWMLDQIESIRKRRR